MLGGIGMAGAEQHGENRHGDGNKQRHVAERCFQYAGFDAQRCEHPKRKRHGLQLQRDVRDDTDDGNQRHQSAKQLVLAITCRQEVCDRRDVLGL